MLELYEGVPGSGKSYHAVQDFLLKWVRAGRRVYTYIDGFYLDRLAAFEGKTVEELEKQITNWPTAEAVMQNLTKVEPGCAIFIDECQTIFRAQTKVPAGLLRWLETHRHYGVDLLLACQDHRQVTGGVTRLVEVTTKFRKLSRIGLGNRYQGKIRGNPDETEDIRSFVGKYDPKVYAYYSSYRAAVREQGRGYSIFRSLFVTGSLAAGVAGVMFLLWLKDNPLSQSVGTAHAAATPAVDPKKASALPPPPSRPAEAGSAGQSVPAPAPELVHVEGSFHDGTRWRYLIEGGRIVSGDELAALGVGVVREVESRGVVHPEAERLVWGGRPRGTTDLAEELELTEKYHALMDARRGSNKKQEPEDPNKKYETRFGGAMGTNPPRPAYYDYDPVMAEYQKKEGENAHSVNH